MQVLAIGFYGKAMTFAALDHAGLLELVKAKMREAHQQEQDEVRQVESALRQVDSALDGGGNLYSGLSAAAGITPTLTMASVASVGNISVQA